MNVLKTFITLPTFSSSTISFNLSCLLAKKPSKPPPATPTIPTFATSPSINAFVACVVECATNTTSKGSILKFLRQFLKLCTTPAATPSLSSWVVFTWSLPIISCVSLSIATHFVYVPPTSIPMRTFLFPILLPF